MARLTSNVVRPFCLSCFFEIFAKVLPKTFEIFLKYLSGIFGGRLPFVTRLARGTGAKKLLGESTLARRKCRNGDGQKISGGSRLNQWTEAQPSNSRRVRIASSSVRCHMEPHKFLLLAFGVVAPVCRSVVRLWSARLPQGQRSAVAGSNLCSPEISPLPCSFTKLNPQRQPPMCERNSGALAFVPLYVWPLLVKVVRNSCETLRVVGLFAPPP
jgi:hypothetical protein